LVHAQDLRDKYGTRSLAAARSLDQGIRLSQQRKAKDALKQLEAAIEADGDLQLAHYWKALTLNDLGRVDEGLQAFKELIELGERTEVSSVVVDGCINLALTYARLEEEKEAAHWFTKALLLDPTDRFQFHWKAYRNMAISLNIRRDYDSAAMCALLGVLANPRRVEFRMAMDFLERSKHDNEVVKVLHFAGEDPQPSRRLDAAPIRKLDNVAGLPTAVTDLQVDPYSGTVVAISAGRSTWASITSGEGDPRVASHEAPGKITSATLVGGSLFVCVSSPARLVELNPATGDTVKSWNLPATPSSIAVVPLQEVAFFPQRGQLRRIDLRTSQVTDTEYFSDGVASDPLQRFCYSYIRDEGESGQVIVNGRPIRFTVRDRWTQTTLGKYAVAERRLMFAAMRVNASSNGRKLHVSPDGHWVASVGRGGWRPTSQQTASGYGVAFFSSRDLADLQGFYKTDAYPLGVAVNPATGQVVTVREKDAKIHHLSKANKENVLSGSFKGPAAWSPDGKYLYLATKQELTVWENPLSAPEQQLASAWIADLQNRTAKVKESKDRDVAVTAVEGFDKFELKNNRREVSDMLKTALATTDGAKPLNWLKFEEYQASPDQTNFFIKTFREISAGQNLGILTYRLKKMEKKEPDHPGFDFLLGMSTFTNGQLPECIQHHLKAIQTDQGKTNITIESLRCLAHTHRRQNKPMIAAYCMASVLRLDASNPLWLREAKPFFKAVGMETEAKPILEGNQVAVAGGSTMGGELLAGITLPQLQSPRSNRKLNGRGLFLKASPSTVLIKTDAGSGSGVCVGRRGFIVTNQHVVEGARGTVEVYPFAVQSGRTKKLAAISARVVYASALQDIAILKLEKSPSSLVPLEVATRSPGSGERIYAVGSPGLGQRILEQSISEGIVSSAARKLDGQTFIQHTAAVNPGNSGGPLLNSMGHVVGVVTLKAGLENVSFAVPAETLREIFESVRK
jgi:S1-C subfamily serine protease/DNA-binding beta-propeller fold protein YncE